MTRTVQLAALLAIIVLIPSTSAAPVDHVTALAPVEIWADGFGDLRGIAIDGEGSVYVADRLIGTVTRIGPDRSRTVLASGLDHPVGLAFDPSGRLVIAEEQGNRVIRVEGNGRQTVVISGIRQPRWVTFAANGTLYVSARASTPDGSAPLEDESIEPQVILRLTPSGQLDVLVDGFLGLQGIVVSDDLLYAATVGRPGGAPRGVVYAVTLLADGTAGPVAPVTGPDGAERPTPRPLPMTWSGTC